MESKKFLKANDIVWEQLGGGVSRQILGYNTQIMMVKVKFEKGAVGALHHHFHSQTTYVVSGVFEVTIGDEKTVLKGGDSFYIPPTIPHTAICVEEGMLIDVFSPVRMDFLDGSKVAYFGNK